MGLFDFSFNITPSSDWLGKSSSRTPVFPSYLREMVCELQGNYAQFAVVAHNLHKTLREEWSTAPNTQLHAINESRKRLYLHLINNARKACTTVEKFGKEHFANRSKFKPRFCVKLPCEPDCEILDDLYRCSGAYNHRVKASENTAFNFIRRTGKSFVSNDLVAEVFGTMDYVNPRLDTHQVKAHYPKLAAGKRRFHSYYKRDVADAQWQSLWKEPTGGPSLDYRSCYKSTLVVPMTLINAQLADEFKEFVLGGDDSTRYSKLTFGFLCWDHINANYFQDHDEHFGYIAADLLSLFMITAFGLTTRSNTCDEINKAIGEMPQLSGASTTMLHRGGS